MEKPIAGLITKFIIALGVVAVCLWIFEVFHCSMTMTSPWQSWMGQQSIIILSCVNFQEIDII